MSWRSFFLGTIAVSLYGQIDPKDLLLQAKAKIVATTTRMPRYMCTQTIDRGQSEPDKGFDIEGCAARADGVVANRVHLTESDRLRLDVTVAAGSEIFSWVGENHFGDRTLWDFMLGGVLSTGAFYSFLSMIFVTDAAEFSYNGEVLAKGATVLEFAFKVPAQQSHYRFGNRDNNKWWTTAYEGAAQVDPKTATLVRLVVRSVDLPSETGECQLETTLRYGTIHLNESDFLLPSETILKTSSANGIEKTNRTLYSSCHEFLGESKISFDDAADIKSGGSVKKPNVAGPHLAAGTRFALELIDDIDLQSAAAGDPVRARLKDTVRSKGLTIPKGTIVEGRIVQAERYYRPAALLVTVGFESFDLPGNRIAFHADWLAPSTGMSNSQSVRSGTRSLGTLDSMSKHNLAKFRFSGPKATTVIKGGIDTRWSVVSP